VSWQWKGGDYQNREFFLGRAFLFLLFLKEAKKLIVFPTREARKDDDALPSERKNVAEWWASRHRGKRGGSSSWRIRTYILRGMVGQVAGMKRKEKGRVLSTINTSGLHRRRDWEKLLFHLKGEEKEESLLIPH